MILSVIYWKMMKMRMRRMTTNWTIRREREAKESGQAKDKLSSGPRLIWAMRERESAREPRELLYMFYDNYYCGYCGSLGLNLLPRFTFALHGDNREHSIPYGNRSPFRLPIQSYVY